MSASLGDIVRGWERRGDLFARMAAIYSELDREIEAIKPRCINRGACCRFGSYGHRLFVSSVELAYFQAAAEVGQRSTPTGDICPYQVSGLCTARQRRPLGCRIFFCDPASQEWQGPLYEHYMDRLKTLGEEFGIEYRYVEWLSALAEISAPPAGVDGVVVAYEVSAPGTDLPTGAGQKGQEPPKPLVSSTATAVGAEPAPFCVGLVGDVDRSRPGLIQLGVAAGGRARPKTA